MIEIKDFNELLEMLDIEEDEVIENSDDGKESYPSLKRAIKKGRIFINDNTKVVVKLKESIKIFSVDNSESDEVEFRRASGYERRICANAPDNRKGDAIQKCISHMTKIRQAELDKMDSKELGILEDVFSLFL